MHDKKQDIMRDCMHKDVLLDLRANFFQRFDILAIL